MISTNAWRNSTRRSPESVQKRPAAIVRASARPIAQPISAPRIRVTEVSRSRLSKNTASPASARANATFNPAATGSGCSTAAAYATAATKRMRARANHAIGEWPPYSITAFRYLFLHQLDAPVHCTPLLTGIVRDGARVAESRGREARRADAVRLH